MAKDILFENPFYNGDFNFGFSDEQHISHLLLSAPGHIKHAPLAGINITDTINASLSPAEQQKLERLIRLNLEADGAKEINVTVDPQTSKINIDAKYS